MAEENSTTSPAAEAPPVTELQVLNGGVEIDAALIDGTSERVKVRQLPIALQHQYGLNQGAANEAYLIELLCDRLDRTTTHHLSNAYLAEMRVREILRQASFAQLEEIEKRLSAIRTEIAAFEAKPRWSDKITYETAVLIRELGERLNKKKFVDQQTRTLEASGTLLEMLKQSASPTSSSPLPGSGKSPTAT